MIYDESTPSLRNAKFLERDVSSGGWRVTNSNGKLKSFDGHMDEIPHDEFIKVSKH